MTSWADVVTAATVGLAQRPVELEAAPGLPEQRAGLPADDPAGRVLAAAALHDVAARAGRRSTAAHPPAPAPPDTRPELGRPAAALVAPKTLADPTLLAELLGWTAAAGLRLPPPVLPALLDVGARDRSLRSPLAAVLGARGRWLAELRPEWRWVAGAADADTAGDPERWRVGNLAERVDYLTELRRRDPAAARALLEQGWADEPGEARAAFVAVLADCLEPADEQFLDRCVADRRADVRAPAATLLTRLPGSAFARRAAALGLETLTLERRALRRRLLVTPPEVAEPGRRAEVVVAVVAAVPLAAWVEAFDAPPAALAGLPVDGAFAAEVHAGWRRAARDQRDVDWARALLARGRPRNPPPSWTPDSELTALLPPAERAARLIARLRAVDPGDADLAAELAACLAPWPDELTAAALAHLESCVGRAGAHGPSWPAAIARAVEHGASVTTGRDWVGSLRALAEATAPEGLWLTGLRAVANTIDLRRRFHRALFPDPEAP